MKLDEIKKIYTILLIIILSIIFVIPVYGNDKEKIQYQDYEWGMKKSKVVKKLKEKGIKSIKEVVPSPGGNMDYEILYIDKLYGNKIEVSMYFTPKSKKLSTVMISSYKPFHVDIKDILEEKYGDSKQISKMEFGGEYEIEQKNTYINFMISKHPDDIRVQSHYLTYYSKKYSNLGLEEYDELMKEEEDKL